MQSWRPFINLINKNNNPYTIFQLEHHSVTAFRISIKISTKKVNEFLKIFSLQCLKFPETKWFSFGLIKFPPPLNELNLNLGKEDWILWEGETQRHGFSSEFPRNCSIISFVWIARVLPSLGRDQSCLHVFSLPKFIHRSCTKKKDGHLRHIWVHIGAPSVQHTAQPQTLNPPPEPVRVFLILLHRALSRSVQCRYHIPISVYVPHDADAHHQVHRQWNHLSYTHTHSPSSFLLEKKDEKRKRRAPSLPQKHPATHGQGNGWIDKLKRNTMQKLHVKVFGTIYLTNIQVSNKERHNEIVKVDIAPVSINFISIVH